ncbi:hypothetical protein CONLIGDRAFT_680260 [Coniochaeta ligniaria NRRL 30616]|uniref:Uncharacterized protein n=1 Tax=Coniochaeta ligniaria NRRL 30616 TaxID=1408157 RepID=A0A1J7IQD4_9PEZI|nr:hypothetical protein CONLIGDRAFT_680260 [Coniochaeta ligniaria NRRL 30616]
MSQRTDFECPAEDKKDWDENGSLLGRLLFRDIILLSGVLAYGIEPLLQVFSAFSMLSYGVPVLEMPPLHNAQDSRGREGRPPEGVPMTNPDGSSAREPTRCRKCGQSTDPAKHNDHLVNCSYWACYHCRESNEIDNVIRRGSTSRQRDPIYGVTSNIVSQRNRAIDIAIRKFGLPMDDPIAVTWRK